MLNIALLAWYSKTFSQYLRISTILNRWHVSEVCYWKWRITSVWHLRDPCSKTWLITMYFLCSISVIGFDEIKNVLIWCNNNALWSLLCHPHQMCKSVFVVKWRVTTLIILHKNNNNKKEEMVKLCNNPFLNHRVVGL